MNALKQAQHIDNGLPDHPTLAQMPLDPSGANFISGFMGKALPLAKSGLSALQGLREALPTSFPTSMESVKDMLHPGSIKYMDSQFEANNPLFRKLEESGMFSGPRTTSGLQSPPAETLGESNPEFTPVGAESLYNYAKAGLKHVPKAEELVRYLGGMTK